MSFMQIESRGELAILEEQHFEKSGLWGMIVRQGNLGVICGGTIIAGSGRLVVRQASNSNRVEKVVDIKTTSDGTIKIQGGLFGSETFLKPRWNGEKGQGLLEESLIRGCKHPRTVRK